MPNRFPLQILENYTGVQKLIANADFREDIRERERERCNLGKRDAIWRDRDMRYVLLLSISNGERERDAKT